MEQSVVRSILDCSSRRREAGGRIGHIEEDSHNNGMIVVENLAEQAALFEPGGEQAVFQLGVVERTAVSQRTAVSKQTAVAGSSVVLALLAVVTGITFKSIR